MAERTFRLHETTRKALCRAVFVLLGVLPLAICVCLSIAMYMPGYARWQASQWEKRLTRDYGISVQIGQIRSLSPYRYQIEAIELFHPESQCSMGSIGQVELFLAGGTWNARIAEAKLKADQCRELVRVVHDWYICRPLAQRSRATLQLDRLLIEDRDRTFLVANVNAELLPEATQWALQATFRSNTVEAQTEATSPNQLIVIRRHPMQSAATDVQLRVATALPLWLLESSQPSSLPTDQKLATGQLLESGQFTGVLDIRYTATQTNFYLTNVWINNLDMSLFDAGAFPLMSGRGNLFVNQAKVDSEGLQWAEGMFEMGPGRIDTKFFQSLSHHLQLKTTPQNPTQTTAFDRLVAHFRARPNALQLVGGAEGGGILIDGQGALAQRNDPSPVSISNLIHALASTPNSSQLVRSALVWLPLEEAQRRETAGVLRLSRNP